MFLDNVVYASQWDLSVIIEFSVAALSRVLGRLNLIRWKFGVCS